MVALVIRQEVLTAATHGLPGHIGLPGTEAAGATTKTVVLGNLASHRNLCSDVRAYLHSAILWSWQDEWTQGSGNKLQMVKRTIAGVALVP
jgi:hypothetical protein